MQLNNLKPAVGSKFSRKRVGRGPGSGLGKTAGRGHKGQKARAGGYHDITFEGGQMPLQMRLPKVGFTSRVSLVTESVRLSALNCLEAGTEVTVATLKAAGLINSHIKRVKIMLHGELHTALNITASIRVTAGARQAIEACGGKVGV